MYLVQTLECFLGIHRGSIKDSAGIELPTGECIRSLAHGETYKYLGVLENCGIHHNQIKQGIACEYKTDSLSGRNKLQAINALALPVIRYTPGIVHWPVNTLEELDRQTRKLLTIHVVFIPNQTLIVCTSHGVRWEGSLFCFVCGPPRRMLFISLCEPE